MPRKPLILLSVALLIAVGLVADLAWREYTRPKYAVEVDGHLVGALREPDVAKHAVDSVLSQVPPEVQSVVNLAAKVNVRPITAAEQQRETVNVSDIEQALVKTMPDYVIATAIAVNGNDVVAVDSVESAKKVKDSILEEYRATVLRDATDIEQLAFAEKIEWRPKVIPAERVRTTEEATTILKHGTDRLVTYEVQKGDTGWDIARSYNVTTDELSKANPTVDIDQLQIGQVLNVTFKDPYVHTVSVSKRVAQEAIPFTEQIEKDPTLWPWQYKVVTPGVSGRRQLVIREYRENGQIIKYEVVENTVLSNPKVQTARQGTKQVPDMGTGSLVYPVVGVTTSYFGPRWGSVHQGIDVGASTGTPVLAADSGMVVFRGWDGNYGYAVHIDHGGGKMETWYAHLSGFNVSLGDTVNKGDVVGYVGNTGFSTGPHLHYEVRVNGVPVNPLSFYQ